MKRSFLMVTAGLALSTGLTRVEAGWRWINPFPQGNDLKSVCVVDYSRVLAVGDAGTILRSTDAGASWRVQHIGPTQLMGVDFPDPVIGYVCGQGGTILKSEDGGANWTQLSFPAPVTLNAIQFPMGQYEGYCCGDSGIIAKTQDGGELWSLQSLGRDVRLQGIWFVSSTIGYLTANSGRVFKTNDGGITWRAESVGAGVQLYGVCFPRTAEVGYASGDNSLVFKTTDGGLTWAMQTLPTPEPIAVRAVWFRPNADTGYAAGDMNSIYRTTDGGANWLSVSGTPFGVSINSLQLPSGPGGGFAVGSLGTILRSESGGSNWNRLTRGFSGPLLDLVFPVDTTTGYATTPNGIYKTTDAGRTWMKESTPGPITALSFPVDNQIGFGVGAEGVIVKTTDGGANWLPESCPGVRDNYVAVSFPANANTGYACGMSGSLVKTQNGGASWTVLPAPDTEFIPFTIYFRTELFGFSGGLGNVIYRTTDGGVAWTGVTVPARGIRSFCFPTGPDTGYACGFDGAILKTVDQGLTWQPQPLPEQTSLSRIVFPDDNRVGYCCGDQAATYLTTDGGMIWRRLSPPAALVNFTGAAFPVNAGHGYFAGDAGQVLRLDSANLGLAEARLPFTNGSKLKIYPSPARTLAKVAIVGRSPCPQGKTDCGPAQAVLVFDRSGSRQVCPARLLAEGSWLLDISQLPAGIYFVTMPGVPGHGQLVRVY